MIRATARKGLLTTKGSKQNAESSLARTLDAVRPFPNTDFAAFCLLLSAYCLLFLTIHPPPSTSSPR
jgi:hypothetical protein